MEKFLKMKKFWKKLIYIQIFEKFMKTNSIKLKL